MDRAEVGRVNLLKLSVKTGIQGDREPGGAMPQLQYVLSQHLRIANKFVALRWQSVASTDLVTCNVGSSSAMTVRAL